MAYQALYRKYRPASFSEVVGQEHITKTLKNELSDQKISHAYLFTGTRGTGKTSCAKILAKAVNCLSPVNGDACGECEICRLAAEGELTDIVEIDAASNNSVDSIRELREQIAFAPATTKYRVYIIDEVHMLSISAFNALLKTLEEPPAHAIFILATTEVHKLPATILSRCQRFDFKRIGSEEICNRIQKIAKDEGFTVTDSAALLIAAAADGGMRDALSILDLCASHSSDINEDVVSRVCAMAGNEYLLSLAEKIKNRDTENALLLLDELHQSSVDMLRLLNELISHYRNLMIIKTVKGKQRPIVCSSAQLEALEAQGADYDIREIIAVLNILQETAAKMQVSDRRSVLELTIIRLCNPTICGDIASLERRVAALESGAVTVSPSPKTENSASKPTVSEVPPITEDDDDEIPLPTAPPDEEPIPVLEALPKSEPKPSASANTGEAAPLEEWSRILQVLNTLNPLITGVLSGSSAYIKGDYLLIDSKSSQFKNLVNGSNPAYRNSIRAAAQQVLGKAYKLGPYHPSNTEEANDPLAAFAERLRSFENN